MATINKYQRALLGGYPNIELLPMDASDDADVLRAVSEGTGDGLFQFLWNELADHGDDDLYTVATTLRQAIDDIDRVMNHIALVVAPEASAPSA